MDLRSELEDAIRRMPREARQILLADLHSGGMADSNRLSEELGLSEYAVCMERLRARRILERGIGEQPLLTWSELLDAAGVEVSLRPLSKVEEEAEKHVLPDGLDVEKLHGDVLSRMSMPGSGWRLGRRKRSKPALWLMAAAAAVVAVMLVPAFLRQEGGGSSALEVGLLATKATPHELYVQLGVPEELRPGGARGAGQGSEDPEELYRVVQEALDARRRQAFDTRTDEYRANHFSLSLRVEEACHVGVLQIDSRGRCKVAYPENEERLPRLEPSEVHELPRPTLTAIRAPGEPVRLEFSKGFYVPGSADWVVMLIATGDVREVAVLESIANEAELAGMAPVTICERVTSRLLSEGFAIHQIKVVQE